MGRLPMNASVRRCNGEGNPIKSVPAVTTSPLSPFHVERRLFVPFPSRWATQAFRSLLANLELATRKMERQAKSAIRKSESRVTTTRFVARDSVGRNNSELLISPTHDSMKLNFYAEKEVRYTIYARYTIPRHFCFTRLSIITQDFAIRYMCPLSIESR
ncbi:hypothetical protein ALC62_00965 [Cyphomyrmex costatus]|uniref:Uncharacterized protein n=1 Tax=Cyphomyrmex costatus TaxID=456900 RepID=A0A195D5F0_9HYME|nr:hypothetical protein ALC62_00965 [Cyphomyrmex costatus]